MRLALVALAVAMVGTLGCAERPTMHEPADGGIRDGADHPDTHLPHDTHGDHWPIDVVPGDRILADRPFDGGSFVGNGARWTNVKLVRPESIAAMANIALPGDYSAGRVVGLVAARPAMGLLEVLGGTGDLVTPTPPTYAFASSMAPAPVLADTAARPDGRTDFATQTSFAWDVPFIAGAPPLRIHGASLTGNLDGAGVPTSSVPTLSGTAYGCFTVEQAKQQYIEVLGKSLYEMIAANGGASDTGCGPTGAPGYAFELQWEAKQVVQLTGG